MVFVRPLREIATTLDTNGTLEGLPFLAEMVKYCGRSFRVRRRVNKLIQEGVGSSMRRIRDVVLLEGTVCDGHAHGDCQRACFPLWKVDWLEPASGPGSEGHEEIGMIVDGDSNGGTPSFPSGSRCQVTELLKATRPLPLWHPLRHYWDFTARTYSPRDYLAYVLRGVYKKTLKRVISKALRRNNVPPISTPEIPLDLKSGDLVEVKSAAEIKATLNADGRCCGLYFMPGMKAYCGRRFRVRQPVERMMSERTGEMRSLSRTVLLEDATCDGKASGGCQRACYVFWKEAWLRRIDE
jgi:hypothetical protein